MKVEIKSAELYEGKGPEVFGIELISENEEELAIIERFWEGGVHTNVWKGKALQLTFADLIGT